MRCGAVILAAGASRRLGMPKQLVEHAGRPLVVDAAGKARDAGCDTVVVVTGAYASDVESVLVTIPWLTLARNHRWRAGPGTGVAVGIRTLRSLEPTPDTVLMMLCDQPLIPVVHLRTLIEAIGPGVDIAATRHADGHGGVPACFGAASFDELAELEGTVGARTVIARSERSTQLFETPAAEFDIDTPADVLRLTEHGG